MRVRTSHAPDGWRDEGPCPDVSVGRSAFFRGSLVIGSEPRPHDRCTTIIPGSGRRCCLRDGHDFKHRSET